MKILTTQYTNFEVRSLQIIDSEFSIAGNSSGNKWKKRLRNKKILRICDFYVFPVPLHQIYFQPGFLKNSCIIKKERIIILLVSILN